MAAKPRRYRLKEDPLLVWMLSVWVWDEMGEARAS